MRFQAITEHNVGLWAGLEAAMFSLSHEEALESCHEMLRTGKQAAIVAIDDSEVPVGYVNVSIRHDYVAGVESSPAGFLEAVYVVPQRRKQGIAAALVREAEQWVLAQGCTEMGSDALLENADSHAFHAKLGFKEVERVVSFSKRIDQAPS